jgi:hypothetical protein
MGRDEQHTVAAVRGGLEVERNVYHYYLGIHFQSTREGRHDFIQR